MNLLLNLQLSLWPCKKKRLPGPKRNKSLLPWTSSKVSNKIASSPFMGWPIIWSWWYEGIEMSLMGKMQESMQETHPNIPMPGAPTPLQVARNSLWSQNFDPALWAADSGWGSPRKTWTSWATCTWKTWVGSNVTHWCSVCSIFQCLTIRLQTSKTKSPSHWSQATVKRLLATRSKNCSDQSLRRTSSVLQSGLNDCTDLELKCDASSVRNLVTSGLIDPSCTTWNSES